MTRFSHVLSIGANAETSNLRMRGAMRAIAADHTIVSAAVTNLSDQMLSLDMEVAVWRQDHGIDTLAPSSDIRVKARQIELPSQASRIVCLAVTASDRWRERAYQLLFKDAHNGALRGAIPLFVTPIGAKVGLCANVLNDKRGPHLVVANVGCAHARMEQLTGDGIGAIDLQPYLLAGAKTELSLPRQAKHIRIVAQHMSGERLECSAFEAPANARAG